VNLLLDTHAFLWWITDSPRLSELARARIADRSATLFWSAASTWEVGIKYALDRLPLPAPPRSYLPRQLEKNGMKPLAITDIHAYQVAALPRHHADPFDRMLIAQAQVEKLTLVSVDSKMRQYDVEIVW